jgi:hypothetical protein
MGIDSMDTAQCISNEMWEGYAQKTLSPNQLQALQQHVAGCELCADMKEGIDTLAHPEMLPQTVAAINAEVDKYLKPKRKRMAILWYWSAAAVLLIGLGIGWYNLTPVADNRIVKSESIRKAEEGAASSEVEENVVKRDSVAESRSVPSSSIPLKERVVNSAPVNAESVSESKDKSSILSESVFKSEAEETEKVAGVDDMEEKDAVITESTVSPPAVDYKKEATQPLKKEQRRDIYPSNNNLTNNFRNNNITNNSDATNLNFFSREQDSLNYLTALNYFDTKQYDSCLLVLQSVVYTYYEQAQLLRAKALIKQNKTADAKEILESLIFTDEKLKKEATELLKSIK